MECTLMHKNKEVAELVIDEGTANINEIGEIHKVEHLPLGVMNLKGGVDRIELNDWLRTRSIPASRDGVRDLCTRLGRSTTEYLVVKCYGLSLSDHYWLRPNNSGLVWPDINFFQNEFSKDVGEMLFGREPEDKSNIDLISPDNTSDGQLRKKWIISDGKRMLVKDGSGSLRQEPFNEVIAGVIMQRLGIAHVPYSIILDGGEAYSVCENFLTVDTEFVPAWSVFHSKVMENGNDDYSHLLRCCEEMGIPDTRAAIGRMLTLDYIIANRDRHYSNFGFVRAAETLEWKGFAPIFDSGASLWNNTNVIGGNDKSRPFRKTHDEQIKLVSDLSWYDYGALDGIKEECAEIFAASKDIDAERREKLTSAIAARCGHIERLRRN